MITEEQKKNDEQRCKIFCTEPGNNDYSCGDNSVYHHFYGKRFEFVNTGYRRGIQRQCRLCRLADNRLYFGCARHFRYLLVVSADITCRKIGTPLWVSGIFVACCIVSVFSVSMVMLMAVRIIQGIGASMIFSTNTAVLISAFPGNMRGKVIGYSIASTYVGLSAGPVVGGFLNHALGWRAIFIVTGIIGLISFVAAFWKLPMDGKTPGNTEGKGEDTSETGKSRAFDLGGNILYVMFIVLLMYGLSEINRGMISILCAVSGIIFGVLFIHHELKTETPVVNVRLFRENAGYAFSNLSALLNYGATFAISYLISIYLQVVMGYTSQAAGLIMISQPAIMAVLTPITGRFSDRFHHLKCLPQVWLFVLPGHL